MNVVRVIQQAIDEARIALLGRETVDAEIAAFQERQAAGQDAAPRPRRRRRRPGQVYLARRGDRYKIGQSAGDAQGRAHSNQTRLLHVIWVNDMTGAERYLFERFADRRLDGEWFALSEEEVAWFCSLHELEV